MSRLPVPLSLMKDVDSRTDGASSQRESDDLGRVRSYPHERGQWTEHIRISVPEDVTSNLMDLSEGLQNIQTMEKPHISLSRGHFTLRYHQLDPFVRSLASRLQPIFAFSVCLDEAKIFYNDDQTRGFICLCDSNEPCESFQAMKRAVEKTREDFGLSSNTPAYEEPFIIHSSLFWFLPEFAQDAEDLMAKLQAELHDETILIQVDQVNINLGNQDHILKLQKRRL